MRITYGGWRSGRGLGVLLRAGALHGWVPVCSERGGRKALLEDPKHVRRQCVASPRFLFMKVDPDVRIRLKIEAEEQGTGEGKEPR